MLDHLISDLKTAARGPEPEVSVKSILGDFVADPAAARAAMPDYAEDDVIIFEDDSVSIWFCRFQPGMSVPPHDHRMSATIAVFQGVEQNDLYTREGDAMPELSSQTPISAGQVVQIPADGIHGVTCTSDVPSEAIHVYLGALTEVDRTLFDTSAGEPLAYTDENYHRLMTPGKKG